MVVSDDRSGIMVFCACKSTMGRGEAAFVLERGFGRVLSSLRCVCSVLLLIYLGS